MSATGRVQGDLPRLAAPARRALKTAGIADLAQLAEHSKSEIEAFHGIGPNALEALEAAMRVNGLAFR